MTWKSAIAAAVVCMLTQAEHFQTDWDDLWTGNYWYSSDYNIGARHGIPFAKKEAKRRMDAGMALEGTVSDYATKDNVIRVKSVFPETDFEDVFSLRKSVYTYEGFLNAVGKFSAFCGEHKLKKTNGDAWTDDDACRRELATLFAHINQETGGGKWNTGLQHITEYQCTRGYYVGRKECDYKKPWYSSNEDKQYFGRGPLQLSYNYNYGPFSKVMNEDDYNGESDLLNNPENVAEDALTIWLSALWFYMTPQSPKPSMHDVVTGHMQPTEEDKKHSFGPNFGTTINIINGGLECGKSAPYPNKALKRGKYYKKFLNYFKLDKEDDLGCANQPEFPTGGWGDDYGYWKGFAGSRCVATKEPSSYSIYTRNDYKRCVCDYVGDGKSSCE